jgi:hypothetical protein
MASDEPPADHGRFRGLPALANTLQHNKNSHNTMANGRPHQWVQKQLNTLRTGNTPPGRLRDFLPDGNQRNRNHARNLRRKQSISMLSDDGKEDMSTRVVQAEKPGRPQAGGRATIKGR